MEVLHPSDQPPGNRPRGVYAVQQVQQEERAPAGEKRQDDNRDGFGRLELSIPDAAASKSFRALFASSAEDLEVGKTHDQRGKQECQDEDQNLVIRPGPLEGDSFHQCQACSVQPNYAYYDFAARFCHQVAVFVWQDYIYVAVYTY